MQLTFDGFDQHVIHEGLHVSSRHILEDQVNNPLIGSLTLTSLKGMNL